MGLYNFKPIFEGAILAGRKKHTIRAARKYPDRPGDTLYLYTGLRTKEAKLLAEVECVKVEQINIWPVIRALGSLKSMAISIDGVDLDDSECEHFARRDGFKSLSEMMKFWTTPKTRLPFSGQIIHWRAR